MKLCTQRRLRLERLGVRLAGLRDRLGTDAVVDAGEREQVTELGCVDHERSAGSRGAPPGRDRSPSPSRPGRRDPRTATGFVRRKICSRPDSTYGASRLAIASTATDGLEGEVRHPAGARVAGRPPWIEPELLVVGADRPAQGVVARGASEALDQVVLVERRDALRRQLPAEPVGLLDETRLPAAPERLRGLRRRRPCLLRRRAPRTRSRGPAGGRRHAQNRSRGIAGGGDARDVDHLVEPALALLAVPPGCAPSLATRSGFWHRFQRSYSLREALW